MFDVEALVSDYRNEADVDFVGLWEIVGDAEDEFGAENQQEIRRYALEVVRGLMRRGVYPGDYTLESFARDGFQFWSGTADELVKRIEAEWTALGKTPDLEHSICWFALRPSEAG